MLLAGKTQARRYNKVPFRYLTVDWQFNKEVGDTIEKAIIGKFEKLIEKTIKEGRENGNR